jgi:hypothetical protein
MARRSEKDYGLPRLTLVEAARVLSIPEGEFWIWLNETLRPSEPRSSKWRNDKEPLPEAIIRLYLMRRLQNENAYHDGMQRLRDEAEQRRKEDERRTARQGAVKHAPRRKAAG